MKIIKISLLLLVISLTFTGCKEAIDKRKIDTKITTDVTSEIKSNTTIAKNIAAQDFKRLIDENKGLLIDVRTPKEFESGHIKGAINIDWTNTAEFTKKIAALSKDEALLIYCRSGHRSGLALKKLKTGGYKEVYNLESGILGWTKAELPTEK